eukprot:scaffold53060_cov29-Tisochrysis_lutea.AAC.7
MATYAPFLQGGIALGSSRCTKLVGQREESRLDAAPLAFAPRWLLRRGEGITSVLQLPNCWNESADEAATSSGV